VAGEAGGSRKAVTGDIASARAKDAGFYKYLTKPIKVVELIAVLEEVLADNR